MTSLLPSQKTHRRPRTMGAGGMLLVAFLSLGCTDLGEGEAEGAPSGGEEGAPAEPSRWAESAPWLASEVVDCPAPVPEGDTLVALLSELSLDLNVGIDFKWYELYGGYIQSDPARLPYFHELQQDLTLVPCTAGGFAVRADQAADGDHPVATQLADAATELGHQLTVGGAWPALSEETPLISALQLLFDDAGQSWDVEAASLASAAVPSDVRKVAARLLLGVRDAARLRDEAFQILAPGASLQDIYKRSRYSMITGPGAGLNPAEEADLALLAPDPLGASTLYSGAVRLGQAVDEAGLQALVEQTITEPFEFYLPTPAGAVWLRGGADDVYDPSLDERLKQAIVLLIDTGGNDVYRIPAGANTSADHKVALHVDLGGDDTYAYLEVPSPHDGEGLLPADDGGRFAGNDNYGPISFSPHARQGAGVLGYGFLIDRGEGKDEYRSLRFSQGFASLGAGVLWDDGGEDQYICESACQAAAVAGIAVLHDGGGNDRYRSFQSSQSFAGVSAFSLLYEHEGDDKYELVPKEPFLFGWFGGYPNNLSKGQGEATGWRGEGGGAVQLGGGVALLRDRAGNDEYRAAVMAQGNGYWFGFGILADGSGDDHYDAVAYAQGATEHFALSAFLEGGGDDVYNERIKDEIETPRNSLGGAHDFSVSVFVEAGGDDVYYVPGIALGASKCHGLGVFIERGGSDRYYSSGDTAIGWATDFDWTVGDCGTATDQPSYGFFVDLDGQDVYEKPDVSAYGDNKIWLTDDPTDSDALELSGGVDVTAGKSFARAYGALWKAEP